MNSTMKRNPTDYERNDEEEEDRKPPAKKKPKISSATLEDCDVGEETTINQKEIDVFSVDLVATTIIEFMNLQELYVISKTNKRLRNMIRHKHVVRAALMVDKRAKYITNSMKNLVDLIEAKKIWIPSPLRVLRICNGKRCELCNENRVNVMNGHYGLFLCFEGCLKNKEINYKVNYNNKWCPFLYHPRVASYHGFLTGPFQDSNRVDVGPLINLQDIKMIQTNGGGGGKKTTKKKKKQTPEEMLAKLDDVLAKRDVINNHHAKYAEEIIETFEQATEDAEARQEDKEQNQLDVTERAIERKRNNVQKMLQKLQHEWEQEKAGSDDGDDDEEEEEKEWKPLALRHTHLSARTSSSLMVRMDYDFVHSILEPYIKSPSKLTKEIRTQVLTEIEESFQLLYENNVHDLSLLPDTDDYDRILKEYLQELYPDGEHLQEFCPIHLDNIRNEEKDPYEMVIWKVENQSHHKREVFQRMARRIASTVTVPPDDEGNTDEEESTSSTPTRPSRDQIEILAHSFVLDEFKLVPNKREDRQKALKSCMTQFPTIYQNALDFLKSKEAKGLSHVLRNNWIWKHPRAPFDLLHRNFGSMARQIALEAANANEVRLARF